MAEAQSSARGEAFTWPVLCVCIGVPLLVLAATDLVYLQLGVGEVFSGYARKDLIYYSANAREIFENGNGLFYGDPFSASDATPRVFSHLQLLLLGWSWHATGIALPLLWQAFQLLGGIAMFAALYRLLGVYFSGTALRYAFFVCALGGGATALAAFVAGLSGADGLTFLQRFDSLVNSPSGTGWGPNVFQNTAFATEAFYHALAFATFTAVLRRRFGWALVGVFCVWWAHPFTGLEVAGITGAFALSEAILGRERRMIWFSVGIAAISCSFLAYYVLALPSWSPEAADILARWRAAALVFHFSDAPAMWGVFLLAIVFVSAPGWRLVELRTQPADRFLMLWLGVVATLLLHDLLLPEGMHPYQPIHFSHGYFFLPLAILTVRGLQRLSEDWGPQKRRFAAVGFLLFASADNVAYTANLATSVHRYVLTAEQAAIVQHLAGREPGLILLGRNAQLAEYLSVMTPHRVYNFSRLQTPYFEDKNAAASTALEYESPASAAALLGIGWVVGEHDLTRSFQADIAAGKARIALRSGPYEIIELLVPAVPQQPDAASSLPEPARPSGRAPQRPTL